MDWKDIRVLHISNGFCTSKVHSNLCRHLDPKVAHQAVYTYIDNADKIGKNKFEAVHTEFVYDKILNRFVRKIYPLRIWWTYYHLKRRLDLRNYNCTFATTLFSDGGVANIIYKKHGIPYIVAVRATDLTIYLKSKLYWRYGRENLLNAKRIILINKANEDRLRTYEFSRPIWNQIKDKVVIQPNGIDSFWLDNLRIDIPPNKHSICYVGTFIKRKKVPQLIRAVESLLPEFPDLKLNLVGSGGDTEAEVLALSQESPFVQFLGQIKEKQALLEVYRSNGIFAMPSLYETFGLVYIEALSQNLRLLYTKETGIDGMFDDIGIAADASSEKGIADALRQLIMRYDGIGGNKGIDMTNFDWNHIADNYMEMFNSIINNYS